MDEMKWWQKAVFYQVYPRSFADENGDGIGDLPGLIRRLDYLEDLGIDAIWLSPHYPSPQYDCGYDIADYTGVAPEYGTLDDFRRFLDSAHRRGIRVILDLVLNHTSDQHEWFLESRSSRDNPKRDWYIWRDGKRGKPPNNWMSPFGGPAWEYDRLTGQYYYHFFFKAQPDLNWRNPEVKQAMFDAVRFWLELGVDGYRLDAIGTIFEDPDMPDHQVRHSLAELRNYLSPARTVEKQEEVNRIWMEMFKYQVERPGIHELLKELREVVDEFEDRVLVAESDEVAYHGSGDDELHMVFNFPLMKTEAMTPHWIRQNQKVRLGELAKISPKAWPCNTLGNHDAPRVKSRYGDGLHDEQIARLNLALMLTLRGAPFLYNGEEIGMTDLILDDINRFRDRLGIWLYETALSEMRASPEDALAMAAEFTRDKCRTPMQWANAPNAGFSPAGVETWLPANPDFAEGVNVDEQQDNPRSLLSFYKEMLRVRKQNPALIGGGYIYLGDDRLEHDGLTGGDYVFAFLRRSREQSLMVVLNYSDHWHSLDFSRSEALAEAGRPQTARLVYSSRNREVLEDGLSTLEVAPFEVYVGEV